jgi:hypothetical protein
MLNRIKVETIMKILNYLNVKVKMQQLQTLGDYSICKKTTLSKVTKMIEKLAVDHFIETTYGV